VTVIPSGSVASQSKPGQARSLAVRNTRGPGTPRSSLPCRTTSGHSSGFAPNDRWSNCVTRTGRAGAVRGPCHVRWNIIGRNRIQHRPESAGPVRCPRCERAFSAVVRSGRCRDHQTHSCVPHRHVLAGACEHLWCGPGRTVDVRRGRRTSITARASTGKTRSAAAR